MVMNIVIRIIHCLAMSTLVNIVAHFFRIVVALVIADIVAAIYLHIFINRLARTITTTQALYIGYIYLNL